MFPDELNPDRILGDLGDKAVAGMFTSIRGAGADFAALRAWRPDWTMTMSQRGIANFIHERIWGRLIVALDGIDGITLVDREPVRELVVQVACGRTLRTRFKRHDERDLVSSYPTLADAQFWAGAVITLPGLEEVRLAAGYRWDKERGLMSEPIISYRAGKTNPLWSVQLDAEVIEDDVVNIQWGQVSPTLPDVTINGLAAVADELDFTAGDENPR